MMKKQLLIFILLLISSSLFAITPVNCKASDTSLESLDHFNHIFDTCTQGSDGCISYKSIMYSEDSFAGSMTDIETIKPYTLFSSADTINDVTISTENVAKGSLICVYENNATANLVAEIFEAEVDRKELLFINSNSYIFQEQSNFTNITLSEKTVSGNTSIQLDVNNAPFTLEEDKDDEEKIVALTVGNTSTFANLTINNGTSTTSYKILLNYTCSGDTCKGFLGNELDETLCGDADNTKQYGLKLFKPENAQHSGYFKIDTDNDPSTHSEVYFLTEEGCVKK